jgi:hypothetical protein
MTLMHGSTVCRLLFAIAIVIIVTGAGVAPMAVWAQTDAEDAARFAAALASRDDANRLAGPLAGELVQQEGLDTNTGAGVSVENFIVSATFPLTAETDGALWDMGFTFRWFDQFIVDSWGFWYYAPMLEGVVAEGKGLTLDEDGDGAVTLDLVVDGTRAYFGTDGTFDAAFDLPSGTTADVLIGTGYSDAYAEPGRVIPYTDFEVWALTTQPEPIPTPTATPSASTPEASLPFFAEDAALFTELLAAQAQTIPLAGPFNANLRETSAVVPSVWAGVHVADFHASATLDVPEEPSEVPWDVGFLFDRTPEGTLRLVVDAQGQVFFSTGGGTPIVVGEATTLRAAAGEANTIDLLVAGGRALFGVNGELAASVELPDNAVAADVGVGTAFYNDHTVSDRLTAFSDFVVRPLAPDALSPAGAAELANADQERFQVLLAETEDVTPATGPFAGRLVESTPGTVPTAAAGVAFVDFGAIATFVNLADATIGPWDIGFQFRDVGDAPNRIVVDSLGDVYVTLAGQPTTRVARTSAYDATPGATNTLQLFIEGERALFGVNGRLVAALDVAIPATPADVLVGTAFFDEDFVAGRVISYSDFQVWEIG